MVGVGHNIRLESYIQVNPRVQIGGAVSVEEEILIGSVSKGKDCRLGNFQTLALVPLFYPQ